MCDTVLPCSLYALCHTNLLPAADVQCLVKFSVKKINAIILIWAPWARGFPTLRAQQCQQS